MSSIIRTIQDVMTAAMIGNKFLIPRQSMTESVLKGFAVLLCGGGLFLITLGVLRFLENNAAGDIAAFITAGITFLFAVILMAVARYIRRKNKVIPAPQDIGNKVEQSIKDVLETIVDEFDEEIRDNPKVAVAISAVAGFIAARQSL